MRKWRASAAAWLCAGSVFSAACAGGDELELEPGQNGGSRAEEGAKPESAPPAALGNESDAEVLGGTLPGANTEGSNTNWRPTDREFELLQRWRELRAERRDVLPGPRGDQDPPPQWASNPEAAGARGAPASTPAGGSDSNASNPSPED